MSYCDCSVTLVGNLCADPTYKTTASGQELCSFDVAVNYPPRKDKDGVPTPEVLFMPVIMFRQEAINYLKDRHLSKGSLIYAKGRLKEDRWQDKTTGKMRKKIIMIAEKVIYIVNDLNSYKTP